MNHAIACRLENVAIAATIGARMREARLALGLSQLDAAAQFGYANSSKLAKIEGGKIDGGKDSSQIPLWVIKRATCLYDVSVDYLLGIHDSPGGRDGIEATDMDRVCRELIHNEARRDAEAGALIHIAALLQDLEQRANRQADAAAEAADALARFVELNRDEWPDMPGGARLIAAVERSATASRASRAEKPAEI